MIMTIIIIIRHMISQINQTTLDLEDSENFKQ